MRDKIIRDHILFRVFIIPVFLTLAISSVPADINLYRETGVSDGNSGATYERGANFYLRMFYNSVEGNPLMNGMDIRTDILQGWEFSINKASYYRAIPASTFSTRRYENTLSFISASMGSSLNSVFKKLKRVLSGISKFF
jgi:hypothetical protein